MTRLLDLALDLLADVVYRLAFRAPKDDPWVLGPLTLDDEEAGDA